MKTISKRIKLARRIVGSVFGVCGMVLLSYVCVEWHRQGCGWQSLVMAVSFYGVLSAGLWYAVDAMIREGGER